MVRKDLLKKLDDFKGYLEGEEIDRFLNTFEIKFGSGTWVVGDFSDRFMVRGYNPGLSSDIISRLERIKRAGVKYFSPVLAEFLRSDLSIDWGLVDSVVRFARENNLVPVALGVDISGFPQMKMGSLTNPDPSLRRRALEIHLEALEVATKLGVDVVTIWPGQDGWDYSLEINYGKRLSMLFDGLREICDKASAKNIRVGIEAKPKEPKEGNMIIPTSQTSIALAKKINDSLGKDVLGIIIDYGHELMYAVEPAYSVYLTYFMDVPLVSIHLNASKYHSNDEDRIIGTSDLWQLIDFLYATIDTDYKETYILDQFPYRMDPVEALRISKEFFANIMKRTLLLYSVKDEFEKIRDSGDQVKILSFLKKYVFGQI
ncbi:MAG: sugar phosphate isomerase/epimerase family protein [Sulfolobales archaeon]